MVFFEEGTRRLFSGKDPATLSSLIQMMPDISYDYALKKLRTTAHEVSWLHRGRRDDGKKDLVWDNCEEAIAAGMSVSKIFRIDCARTLGVFLKVMFDFQTNKHKTHGPDMLEDEISDLSDSLGDIDLRGREDTGQVSEDDATARGTDTIDERETPGPAGTATDEPTTGG
jgi:hypothetical protein